MKVRITRTREALALLIVALLAMPHECLAIGGEKYVKSVPSPGSFAIEQGRTAASIRVDTDDYAGVVRAANDLQTDIMRVTGVAPAVFHGGKRTGPDVIFVGTIGKSQFIDRLIHDGKIDAAQIAGQWESYIIQVVTNPLPGVKRGLIIAGSDKRGTIYGVYDLSEQMGVSPWYWWADVPVEHKDALYVKAGKHVQGPPVVKYRGIFINDEAPALTGLVREKFGGYNHTFYTNVFELLLRLKADYLWPAMWNNCFSEDDPLNPKLADEYGIVMGTSHVEPMMRADKEWNRKGYTARTRSLSPEAALGVSPCRLPTLMTSVWSMDKSRSEKKKNLLISSSRTLDTLVSSECPPPPPW